MSSLIEPGRYPLGAEVCFLDRDTIARWPGTAVIAQGTICGAAKPDCARVKVPVSAVREDESPIMVFVDALNILDVRPPRTPEAEGVAS